RGQGADWPGPVPTTLAALDRSPTPIVPIAEPLRAGDVHRESAAAAAPSRAQTSAARPGTSAARSVATERIPSVGVTRARPPAAQIRAQRAEIGAQRGEIPARPAAATEVGGAQPATADPTPIANASSASAEIVARAADASLPAPRSVVDPEGAGAPSPPRVGRIVSQQPHATASESEASKPEPLPLTGRHIVTRRSDEAGRAID